MSWFSMTEKNELSVFRISFRSAMIGRETRSEKASCSNKTSHETFWCIIQLITRYFKFRRCQKVDFLETPISLNSFLLSIFISSSHSPFLALSDSWAHARSWFFLRTLDRDPWELELNLPSARRSRGTASKYIPFVRISLMSLSSLWTVLHPFTAGISRDEYSSIRE